MESTRKAAIRMATGFGPIKDESQPCESTQDIIVLQRWLFYVLVPTTYKSRG